MLICLLIFCQLIFVSRTPPRRKVDLVIKRMAMHLLPIETGAVALMIRVNVSLKHTLRNQICNSEVRI